MEKSETAKKHETFEFLIDEKLNEAYSWMGPENTVGDFLTVFVENLLGEVIGDELLSVSIKELYENEVRNDFVTKLKARDKFGIWTELQPV